MILSNNLPDPPIQERGNYLKLQAFQKASLRSCFHAKLQTRWAHRLCHNQVRHAALHCQRGCSEWGKKWLSEDTRLTGRSQAPMAFRLLLIFCIISMISKIRFVKTYRNNNLATRFPLYSSEFYTCYPDLSTCSWNIVSVVPRAPSHTIPTGPWYSHVTKLLTSLTFQ